MREPYVFDRDGNLVERRTGEAFSAPDRIACPMLVRDVRYVSPISRTEITSRSQRREEMKVHNVREVEPSEFTPVYQTKRWAERQRGEPEPRQQQDLGEGYKRLSRDELPAKLRRSIA